jgi:hypothetical protein
MTFVGYSEDCCWNDVQDHCPLRRNELCECACHHGEPKRMPRREWESIKIADFERLEDEVDRLTKLLIQIHDIAKNGLDGGDDYEAMREIEILSGGD